MKKAFLGGAATCLAVGWLGVAVSAQPTTPPPSASGTSMQVFDSENAYWVHKGFNDTMFQVN
jgi:hypothetical protein